MPIPTVAPITMPVPGTPFLLLALLSSLSSSLNSVSPSLSLALKTLIECVETVHVEVTYPVVVVVVARRTGK